MTRDDNLEDGWWTRALSDLRERLSRRVPGAASIRRKNRAAAPTVDLRLSVRTPSQIIPPRRGDARLSRRGLFSIRWTSERAREPPSEGATHRARRTPARSRPVPPRGSVRTAPSLRRWPLRP
jgi:hypothetical protein